VPFTTTLAPITGSPLASTTLPRTVLFCNTSSILSVSAKAVPGLPANRAEAIIAEYNILFDENFNNFLFTFLKFKINNFVDIV
jgi:hypothetical protein